MSLWLALATFALAAPCVLLLRRRGGAAPTHFGVAEVMRFAAIRRRIGFDESSKIMACLAARVRGMDDFEVWRVGRTSIEFAYRATNGGAAEAMLRVLKEQLEQRIELDGFGFEPELCIGSAAGLNGQPDARIVDRAACAAEAAAERSDRICLAGDAASDDTASAPTGMLADLRTAIRDGTLDLHYMPKLRLSDDRIVAVEALCRWQHPRHGVVGPATFIGIAEEAGLIGDLTLWVLDRAIADQERLASQGIELKVDVNVSGQLLDDMGFCDRLVSAVESSTGRIGIEITETAVISDAGRALAALDRIKSAGIHIAIDDFGAGLASLGYLRDLPADELKIDQMFVRRLTISQRDPLLVRSAIDIAHALEMEVTAEGVEDPIALALLRVMRCDYVQGYHIAPPLPLAGLIEFMKTSSDYSEALLTIHDVSAGRAAQKAKR